MDLRICGTVLIGIAMICLTWYIVTMKQMKNKAEVQKRRDRQKHNERMNEQNSFALYQSEEYRRRDAETKIGILQDQLRRRDNEIARLKRLISDMEENGGMKA